MVKHMFYRCYWLYNHKENILEDYQNETYLISICKINAVETHLNPDVRGCDPTTHTTPSFYYVELWLFWGDGEKVGQACGITAEAFQ